MAGQHFSRYVEVASRLGSDHWSELEALATSAMELKGPDLASEVFRAADRPGYHQKVLRERCASLTGLILANGDDDRPRLRVVRE